MTRRLTLMPAIGLAAAAALAACLPTDETARISPPDAAMPDIAEGRALYLDNCAMCHGTTGIGDGEFARSMSPPPKNLTLIQVRNADRFPRAKVLSVMDGYTRLRTDHSAMPEFGALLEGPQVPVTLADGSQSPVPRPLAALLVYLESIQKTR